MEQSLVDGGFKKTTGDTFVHPEGKCEVKLSKLQDNVLDLGTANRNQLFYDAALLSTLAPSIAFGPAGLAVCALDLLVVRPFILSALKENGRQRLFAKVPTYVLSRLGIQNITGVSESDTILDGSTALMKKKTLAILVQRELQETLARNPELAPVELRGLSPASFLAEGGAFLSGDFDHIIKPFLALRLFELSRNSDAKWQDFKKMNFDDSWWDTEFFSKEAVTPALLAQAVHEAIPLYLQDLKEKQYIDAKIRMAERIGNRKASGSADAPLTSVQDLGAQAAIENEDATYRDRLDLLGEARIRKFRTRSC